MKRIALYLLTNIFVVVSISIIVTLLGLDRSLTAQGINYQSLLVMCLIYGFFGSITSLLLSRISAKWMMGIELVNRDARELAWVYSMVEDLARKAGLPRTPEVGIYHSQEVNAFATGPSRRRSLVAFSTGLLNTMNRNEVEGVAAHEIAHIANGDMVTMTLIQGVINAFTLFFSQIIAWAITQNMREENRRMWQFFIRMALQQVFLFLGMIVVNAFSRHREFRADHGGARYAGKNDMIAALTKLASNVNRLEKEQSLAAFKISGGMASLFSTHPPLEKRIEALRRAVI
jgi:heat shock protein HtpX